MNLRTSMLSGLMSAALVSVTPIPGFADDAKVALVPGGPHPYFAAWEQAGKDAAKDFGLPAADYRVPQKWELSQQNELLESLLTQSYNSFLIFPGDPVGTVSVVDELTGEGATVISLITGGWTFASGST